MVTALPSCTFGIDVDDTDEVDQIIDIDKDGDGLIEICDLEGLDEMRHALDGSGYKADATATTNTTGCPSGGCNGYELANSLDFMDDDSYRYTAWEATIRTAWTSGAWLGTRRRHLFPDRFSSQHLTAMAIRYLIL